VDGRRSVRVDASTVVWLCRRRRDNRGRQASYTLGPWRHCPEVGFAEIGPESLHSAAIELRHFREARF